MIDLANYYKSINYQKDITYDDVKQAIESKQAAYSVLVEIGKESNDIECIEKYENMIDMAENYLKEIEEIENVPQTASLCDSSVQMPEDIYNSFIISENEFYE